MEVYKVVDSKTRDGSNWTMFKNDCIADKNLEKLGLGEIFKKNNPQFFPIYLKGTIVEAAKESPGILCFTILSAARDFKSSYFGLRHEKSKIIKVKGIGRIKRKFKLAYSCGGGFVNNRNIFSLREFTVSEDVVAFKSVEVLE